MMNFAAIFDMDGLLIDSEPLWVKAEISSFKTVGLSLTENHCIQTTGLRVDEVIQYWFSKKPWDQPNPKALEETIIKTVIRLIQAEGRACPGVHSVLKLCQEQNLPIALASSSSTRIIEASLEKLGIKRFFNYIVSAEYEEYGKPHPGVFLTTARKLGLHPERCLVFEDSVNGVIAAKAARMTTIAVPDNKQLNDPRFHIADLTLSSLNEFNKKKLTDILSHKNIIS